MEKNKKKRTGKGRGFAVIVLIGAIAVYFYLNITTESKSVAAAFIETDSIFEFNYEDKTDIYSFAGKGFFLTTKDGMNFYTSDKQIKWTEPYSVSMKEPLMNGEGQYVGVSDASGMAFYMFSSDGLLYSKNYENRILSFSVSQGGYASVISKSESDYVIQVFDPKGEEINYYYSRNDNIFPVASDVSSDGRMLAICVVDINSTVMWSKLMVLYNNADEKQSWLNGIFFQDSREDELIARLEFLSGNELLFLSDKSLTCLTTEVNGDNSPKTKWMLHLVNEVDSLAVGAGKSIAIAYGKPIPGSESLPSGTVELYNLDLHKTEGYEFSGSASLTASGEYIIAGSGKKYVAFNGKAKRIWEYNAASDVKKLAVLENQNTILVLDNLRAQVIKKR